MNNIPQRTFGETLVSNLVVHVWPVVAVAVDLWLSWSPLSNIYYQTANLSSALGWAASTWFCIGTSYDPRSISRTSSLARPSSPSLFVGFLCFGQTWQKLTFKARGTDKSTAVGEETDTADKSARAVHEGAVGDVVDRYQAPPSVRNWLGRGDDFLFSLLVKFSGTCVALLVDSWLLPRLFRLTEQCGAS